MQIHSTTAGLKNKLSFALDLEAKELRESLSDITLLRQLVASIDAIRVEQAEATVPDDKDKINRLISATDGGHAAINAQVRATMLGLVLCMVTRNCSDESPALVEHLLAQPGVPLDVERVGCNPLTWALVQSKPRITGLLLAAGAQPTAVSTLDLNGYAGKVQTEAGDNKLTDVPAGLMQLVSLTELNLSNNLLSTLPAEMAALAALCTLNLSLNHLEVCPGQRAVRLRARAGDGLVRRACPLTPFAGGAGSPLCPVQAAVALPGE